MAVLYNVTKESSAASCSYLAAFLLPETETKVIIKQIQTWRRLGGLQYIYIYIYIYNVCVYFILLDSHRSAIFGVNFVQVPHS